MKRLCLVLLIFAAVVRIGAADVLSDLGISEGRAREAFFDSFASGSVSLVGNVQVFKSASPQARAAMVKTVTTLARVHDRSRHRRSPTGSGEAGDGHAGHFR